MDTICWHLLHEEDAHRLAQAQQVYDGSPGYYLTVCGQLPAPDEALRDLRELPPGKEMVDKFFYLLTTADGRACGCCDVVRAYPDPHTAYIGLLLFAENAQGQGYGAQAVQYLQQLALSWGCRYLRLGVVASNQRGLAFWQREGFIEVVRREKPAYNAPVIVMQKTISA